MDGSKIIASFLGVALIVCLGLIGTLAYLHRPVPQELGTLATTFGSALAGAMSLKKEAP